MKQRLVLIGLVSLFGSAFLPGWVASAQAGNSAVEATLQSYGDLSMFYQALLNTGVINELNENQHYTIFAPTNAAFAQITHDKYPCFYAVQCRPQIASLLRDHIIVGRFSLPMLTSYGSGIKTGGGGRVRVEEAYVNTYTVNGQTILSKTEDNGNSIYRINGVLATPQQLAQFKTVPYIQAIYPTDTVTENTVTKTYYDTSGDSNYPSGVMTPSPNARDDAAQTTTVIDTYRTQEQ